MKIQGFANEMVLALGEDLERRLLVAAHLDGVEPMQFVVHAIQRSVAEALGELPVASSSAATAPPPARPGDNLAESVRLRRGGWAIRPTRTHMLRSVAEAAGLPIETLVRGQRSMRVIRARGVAAYLLHHDAGLSALDTARMLHVKTNRAIVMVGRIKRVLGTPDPRAQLVSRTRRLFRNGLSSGKPYPPLPPRAAAPFLPGLLACRLIADLTQPELAERAGIARETLSRLERLRRPAQPETAEALARALAVSVARLMTARSASRRHSSSM